MSFFTRPFSLAEGWGLGTRLSSRSEDLGGCKEVIIRSHAGGNDLIFACAIHERTGLITLYAFQNLAQLSQLSGARPLARLGQRQLEELLYSMATVPRATTSNNGEQQDVVLQIFNTREGSVHVYYTKFFCHHCQT